MCWQLFLVRCWLNEEALLKTEDFWTDASARESDLGRLRHLKIRNSARKIQQRQKEKPATAWRPRPYKLQHGDHLDPDAWSPASTWLRRKTYLVWNRSKTPIHTCKIVEIVWWWTIDTKHTNPIKSMHLLFISFFCGCLHSSEIL
jgi:hypothetical protein